MMGLDFCQCGLLEQLSHLMKPAYFLCFHASTEVFAKKLVSPVQSCAVGESLFIAKDYCILVSSG